MQGSYLVGNKNEKRCIYELANSLSGECIGTDFTVEKEMSGLAQKEVSEVNPEREAPERLWTGREGLSTENGIVTNYALRTIRNVPFSCPSPENTSSFQR